MISDQKEEVLRQLKLVRKAKKMSYQDIADGTEDLGVAVSLSTIKRVFAEGSKAEDFRYDATLRPIVRFVMGVDSTLDDLENFEQARANAEGLVAVVDLKDTMISRLESELERTREDHRQAIDRMMQAERAKIDYLKADIQVARTEKAEAMRMVARWRTASILFLSLFVTSLLIVIAYLLVDHSTTDWGIFWVENAAPLPLLAVLFGGAIAGSLLVANRKNKNP